MTVNVEWHRQLTHPPQWKVYCWTGHKLLGQIMGSQEYYPTEYQAKKRARELRKLIKEATPS